MAPYVIVFKDFHLSFLGQRGLQYLKLIAIIEYTYLLVNKSLSNRKIKILLFKVLSQIPIKIYGYELSLLIRLDF